LLLALVLVYATEWVWGYFAKPQRFYVNITGIGLAFIATLMVWRHRPTQQSASETVAELRKVTWPTRKETSQATVVVIITTVIAAMFLQFFDWVWAWLTGKILG
jgi:preprotein translocase subunit SecE